MTNKDQVLAYVRKHGQTTVNELAKALGVQRGTIGQSLYSLTSSGDLEVVTLTTKRVKGEPSTAYRINERNDADLMRLVLFGSAGRKA